MSQIEHRIEKAGPQPDYSGREFTPDDIQEGRHRRFIGGFWDQHGRRQLDYLVAQGLQPHHRLLDIGCGPFRAGRFIIDYLAPGNYFGIDANHSLLEAGYGVELSDEQRAKCPPSNLRANDRFDGDFGVQMDFAIAQSVFTHVSLNHVRLCLYRTAKVMKPGGVFYATIFCQPDDTPVDYVVPAKRGQFYERNVFWYPKSDLAWACSGMPWEFTFLGEWGHPRNQQMCRFVRTTG